MTDRLILLGLALAVTGCDRQPQATPEPSSPSATEAAPAPAPPAPVPAAAPDTPDARRSEFTSIAPGDCRLIAQNLEEAGYSRRLCPGVGGYRLHFTESDLRANLILIRPGGGEDGLDLPATVNGAFSTLGRAVEWRGRGTPLNPDRLIVRYAASENPERPEQATSYLIVARFDGEGEDACAVARVPPGPGQNEAARRIADGAPLPCL